MDRDLEMERGGGGEGVREGDLGGRERERDIEEGRGRKQIVGDRKRQTERGIVTERETKRETQ